MKKKNRRDGYTCPALEKSVNLKTRQEEIEDINTYFDSLPEDAKKWMNSYVEEEVHANLKHKGQKLNKTKADKKRIYNKNNARNRCIYTKEKAQNKLKFVEKLEDFEELLDE